jgi:hypothetical protein
VDKLSPQGIKVFDMGIDAYQSWIFFQVMGINRGKKSRLGQNGDNLSTYQVDKF